jgi:hypothetical protein
LSNLPAISTVASTSNLIQLFTGVTTKTGASAGLAAQSTVETKRQRKTNRMKGLIEHKWCESSTFTNLSLAFS